MKLSDLPRGEGPARAGAIEVAERRYMPAGVLFVFTDGKAIVRSLDEDITEIREIPCASSTWLGGWFIPPVDLGSFKVRLP